MTRTQAAGPARYAVVGDPVEHSLSPRIHAAFAAATGQRMTYDRARVPAGGLAEWLHGFAASGGRGVNVTLPLKAEALALATHASARARAAGAANTLWLDRGGRWCAENTDGLGLLADLSVNLGWPLRDARVLVLGAGGATRGVVLPLLEAGVAGLWFVNRTLARARALVASFPEVAGRLHVREVGEPLGARMDGVINATSAGHGGALPPWPPGMFAAGAPPWCYDMLYGPRAVPWQRAAGEAGAAAVADGLGMLVEQAAAAFWVWRGLRPDTSPVLAELRTALV